MKKIVVAIDGSEMSQKVLLRARGIAEKYGSDVRILTVVKNLRIINYRTGTDINDVINRELENSAQKSLEQAIQMFEGFRGNVETMLAYGEPAEEILLVAEREKPDLLVMGSRGLSRFERAMLGSVSLKVLHHVTCDILIVRNE